MQVEATDHKDDDADEPVSKPLWGTFGTILTTPMPDPCEIDPESCYETA